MEKQSLTDLDKKGISVEDILDEALAESSTDHSESEVQHFNKYQKRL
jgi:hypothetical protein